MAIESIEQREHISAVESTATSKLLQSEPELTGEAYDHRIRLVSRHRDKTIKDHVQGKLTWYGSSHKKND